ncbi:c-type cytochrome [Roseovarius sp. E0-M6]|uniref:c-type cytochrome n=1 Tax=Roseovarius sp. E0-M6 TaxID=3127118 RepID=UPI00300FCB76
MFDTMTFTKILGGFCGAFLIFLMGKWAAETIYHTGGGHGGEEHAAGYAIEVEAGDDAGAEAEEGPSFDELLASADVEKGARVFGKCRACHKLEDGANATGPHLYDVVGRDVGAVAEYGYSGALSEAADVWTAENLNGFLEDPRGYASGTSMSFSGLNKAADRANLIAYLDTIGE